MLDFGWPELLLIIAVAVLVIGPKEIPQIMHAFGRIVRRIQYMKFALSQQFDEFMQDVDMKELQKHADFEAAEGDESDDEELAVMGLEQEGGHDKPSS